MHGGRQPRLSERMRARSPSLEAACRATEEVLGAALSELEALDQVVCLLSEGVAPTVEEVLCALEAALESADVEEARLVAYAVLDGLAPGVLEALAGRFGPALAALSEDLESGALEEDEEDEDREHEEAREGWGNRP